MSTPLVGCLVLLQTSRPLTLYPILLTADVHAINCVLIISFFFFFFFPCICFYLLQVSRPLAVDPVAHPQVPVIPEQTALVVVQSPCVSPAEFPLHAPPSLPATGTEKKTTTTTVKIRK